MHTHSVIDQPAPAGAGGAPAGPRRARLPRWVAALGAGLLAAYLALIWFDLPVPAGMRYAQPPLGPGDTAANWWDKAQGLRGWSLYPEGWAWALLAPASLAYWLVLIAIGLLGGAGLWAWERRRPRAGALAVAGALVALVVLGYALQLAALWLKQPAWLPQPNANQLLYDRVIDRAFTGFFTTAIRGDDPSLFFTRYADAIARTDEHRLCGHCRTHPPGPILFYWIPLEVVKRLPAGQQATLAATLVAATRVTPAPLTPAQDVVALLAGHVILLGAALVVVPLYGIARRLAGPDHALSLAALGLVLPGLVVMSPEFDQMYATFAAVLLYLALRGLSRPDRTGVWGLGTGLVFAACLYWTFGLWVLGIVLGGLAIGAVLGALDLRGVAAPLPVGAALRWLGGLLAGTAVPWLLLWTVGGFDLPRVLAIAGQVHLEGITAYRPYGPWVVFDLVDFLQSTGLPLVVVTLLLLVRREASGPTVPGHGAGAAQRLGARLAARVNLYALGFWVSVLALDGAGVARAEVGRLWIFLMPLALLAVYAAAGRGRFGGPRIAGLLTAQFAVLVLIAGRWLTP